MDEYYDICDMPNYCYAIVVFVRDTLAFDRDDIICRENDTIFNASKGKEYKWYDIGKNEIKVRVMQGNESVVMEQ